MKRWKDLSSQLIDTPQKSVRQGKRERKLRLTMANTHASNEICKSRGIKNVSDHSIALHLIEATFGTACHNSASILPAVLEQSKTFIELRSSRAGLSKQNSNDSACYTPY